MTQTIVCNDDIRWFEQQSKSELTMIVGQMTSLMEAIADTKHDTDARVAKLQNQGWFKRLWNTITGKNKATKEEIRRNQDKIVGYISQAVAKLFELGLIEMKAIQSLGNRINQVYAQITEYYNEQLQMKAQITEIQEIQKQTIQSLGEIASKLDEKIESVDNYHMLRAEIEQGKYKNKSRLYSICSVLSQLDQRTINDERKIEILKVDLQRFNIAPSKSMAIKEYLSEILSLSDEEVGFIYLELCNYKDSFPANMIVETIEEYHFLSRLEKMSKRKKAVIDNILDNHDIEGNTVFAYSDIFESFIENRANSMISLDELEMTTIPSTNTNSFSSNLKHGNSKPESSTYPIPEINEGEILYWKGIQQEISSFYFPRNDYSTGNMFDECDVFESQKGKAFFEEAAKKGNSHALFRLKLYSFISNEIPSILKKEKDAQNRQIEMEIDKAKREAAREAQIDAMIEYSHLGTISRRKMVDHAVRIRANSAESMAKLKAELEYQDKRMNVIKHWLREHKDDDSEALFLLTIVKQYRPHENMCFIDVLEDFPISRRSLLELAALHGHIPAQYELGIKTQNEALLDILAELGYSPLNLEQITYWYHSTI